MPRILVEVNESWRQRFETVLPAAIDTLEGWEHQIAQALTEGHINTEDLLDQLHAQMIDLRRNLQTVRFIF